MVLITSTGAMVLTGLAVLVAIVICVFLVRGIKKENDTLNEEKDVLVDTLLPKTRMREAVNNYATKVGNYGTFTLFYVAIDEFASLKNVVGDDTAQNVVKSIAERLVRMYKGQANIAQFEENSFLIFDKREYNYDDLQDASEKLLDIVSDNAQVLSHENISVTGSIGVATYPTCGVTFKELFSNLQLASYIASRQGGNKYIIYYDELKEEESGNLEYFNEVRNAMTKGELTLFYQPIFDLKNNSIYGFEALVRWNHPVHGIIPPSKFITVLEQSGDIVYLARWSLEQVIRMQQEVEQVFPKKNIKFTLNLSVKQMMEEGMSDDFKKIVRKYGADTSKIILEVAQYAMFEKMNAVRVNLLRLRDMGFLISTDGLGLDYSSITQIETKPIDILKLDKDFLTDTKDNMMQERYVQMLVESCKKTNRTLISEGVENKENLQYIRKNDIDFAQGYYFSKPFPGIDIVNYVHAESWKKLVRQGLITPLESAPLEGLADVSGKNNKTDQEKGLDKISAGASIAPDDIVGN